MTQRWLWCGLLGGAVSGLAGCEDVGELARRLRDAKPPRERYLARLADAGLLETALVRDWIAAGERALRDAPVVSTPHEEHVDLPRAEPVAIGLRIELKPGQLATFDVELAQDTATTVFLDVWRAGSTPDSLGTVETEAGPGRRMIAFEPRVAGWYLFRVQPELLRGDRLRVRLTVAPTLAFPVSGRSERDILSRWGAPRDGGRRSHQGIDIFARRGTPVVAARSGRIAEVGENDLGGLVIWLRDDRGNTHYYAHLSSQLVDTGAEVAEGDTIGLVGNTGNARTTPPHLHFGVYRSGEGPVDPYWFVYRPTSGRTVLSADTMALGRLVRIRPVEAMIRRAPRSAADTVLRLRRAEQVWVLGAVGGWYRVALNDGRQGFLLAQSTERITGSDGPEVRGTGVFSAP